MKTEIYETIENVIYGSGASDEVARAVKQDFRRASPEAALGLFVRHGDKFALRSLSRDVAVPVGVRRNAYMERGMSVSVEELESGYMPEEIPASRGYVGVSKEDQAKVARRLAEAEARDKRFEEWRENARAFRREVGLSEEEYEAWVKQTAGGYRPKVRKTLSGDINPWRDNAVRALEEIN
jgi:hypothetical protein